MINKSQTKIDKLEKWTIFQLTNGKKTVAVISVYRIPMSSQIDVYNTITQYNRIKSKIKSSNQYRKEIFEQIKRYINQNSSEINDIILAGDIN